MESFFFYDSENIRIASEVIDPFLHLMDSDGNRIPDNFKYQYYIDTLATEHGQSKRTIEREYTVKDYYELIVKQAINKPKEKR